MNRIGDRMVGMRYTSFDLTDAETIVASQALEGAGIAHTFIDSNEPRPPCHCFGECYCTRSKEHRLGARSELRWLVHPEDATDRARPVVSDALTRFSRLTKDLRGGVPDDVMPIADVLDALHDLNVLHVIDWRHTTIVDAIRDSIANT